MKVASQHQHHRPPTTAQGFDGSRTTQAMTSNSSGAVSSSQAMQALEQVRNSEGDVPVWATQTVERAIQQLWPRLQSNSNYVMTREEFAIFNYARGRYTQGNDAAVAQRAVATFWNHHRNVDGAS